MKNRFAMMEATPVPMRALGLSVLALAIPMAGLILQPAWLTEEQGLLLWLTALVPPFLLTYYRGWKGASAGLAGGMAALVLANLVLVVTDAQVGDRTFPLWITSTYIAVCVGAGVLSELLRRERAAAEAMALTDELTELPNRRHASIVLGTAFAAATRGQPMCVVFFDLDHFKQVNDRFGHRSGDAVLRRVAHVLRQATRRMDLSARWGGEEFLAILTQCPPAGGASFAERIQRDLRSEVFPWGTVTVSAGVAAFEPGMGSPELLVAAADRALYQAKAEGRNRFVVANAEAAGARTEPGPPAAPAKPKMRRPGRWSFPAGGVEVAEADPGEALPGGSERVLVVDDSDVARNSIVRVLGKLGYRVSDAHDGETALGLAAQKHGFDLVLTDLVMPGMSGFTLAGRLEAEVGPHRILYMSGDVHEEVSWGGAPGTRTGFLEKPMSSGDLARKVRTLLDEPLAVTQVEHPARA